MTLGARVDQTPYVTLGGQDWNTLCSLVYVAWEVTQDRKAQCPCPPGPLALPASHISALSDSEGSHDALCVCACVPSRNTTIQTLMGNPTTSAYTKPNPVGVHSGLLQPSMMHNFFQKDPLRDALMSPWSHEGRLCPLVHTDPEIFQPPASGSVYNSPLLVPSAEQTPAPRLPRKPLMKMFQTLLLAHSHLSMLSISLMEWRI